jgi:hypothetical protein
MLLRNTSVRKNLCGTNISMWPTPSSVMGDELVKKSENG